MKLATAWGEVFQPKFVNMPFAQLSELQRHATSILRHRHVRHLLDAPSDIRTTIRWCRLTPIRLHRITIRLPGKRPIDRTEEIEHKAIRRRAHLGDAARQLIGFDANTNDLADIIARPPAAVA